MRSSRLITILLTVLITSVALAVNNTPPGKGNGRIAFVSNRDHVERIYTMNPDGSSLTKLTNGPHQLQPSWSPDGTKIAYMDTLNDATALYLMNADGSDSKLLASNIFHHAHLAWSPDGKKIAFCGVKGNAEFSLHMIDVDGGHDVRLAEGSASATWSPDGKQIAFTIFDGIDLVDADGTNRKPLVRVNASMLPSLAWSPDGKEILFGAIRTSDPTVDGKPRFTIETIAADGSDRNTPRLLANGSNPSWSPDGSKIVFERNGTEAQLTQIWLMNRDGKNATRLTDTGANWSPSWQPLLAQN